MEQAAKESNMANNAGFLPIALPALKGRRTKYLGREQRVGFSNLGTPLVLPNVRVSAESGDVHVLSTLFTNRQICKNVCEWFTSWRPWQKRILLCSVTEKCTQSQLQVLVTTLEPVFHRDFIAKLKGIYPMDCINSRLVHTLPSLLDAQEMRKFLASQEAKRQENSETADKVSDHGTEVEETKVDSVEIVSEVFEPEVNEEKCGDLSFEKLESESVFDHVDDYPAECPTAAEIEIQEIRRHQHAPFSRKVSTPNFFMLSKLEKLGPMKTMARTGDKQKLYGHAPITFKHAKWWEGHKGRRFLKPRRSKLSNHFRRQLNQIQQASRFNSIQFNLIIFSQSKPFS